MAVHRRMTSAPVRRAELLLVATAALLVCLPTTAQGGAANLVQYGLEFDNGAGSTIQTALAPLTHTRAVTFNFAACTGMQLHFHSDHELFQPILGGLMVGTVNQTNVWSLFNVTAGQLLEIPAGDIHYMINSFSCNEAIVVGTFPLQTNTTFLLPALAAVPPEVQAMFAQTGFPPAQGTFPLIKDTACLARCGLAAPVNGGGTLG